MRGTNYKTILQNQQTKYKDLIKITHSKDYSMQNFHGPDKKYLLYCRNRKIKSPKKLEIQVIEWYHNTLEKHVQS